MSRNGLKIFLFLGVAVFFTAALALAQKTKTVDIYTDAVLPNGQELKAGRYQVVVDETAKQVTFKKGNKVVATAGCQIIEKPEKNSCNEARYTDKDKRQQLQELRLGGERRSILLIQGGM